MVKVGNWLRGSTVRFGVGIALSWLGVALLTACVEVPLNSNPPNPPGGDGGTPIGTDLGVPTGPLWRWESPQPQGNNLRALWGIPGQTVDQDQVYAGGDNGALMIGGSTGWQLQRGNFLDQRAILGISGTAPPGGKPSNASVLAIGFYDMALQQSGGSWIDRRPNLGAGDGALEAVWATVNAGEYYVVGTTGRIYHVTGGGASWSREGSGVTTDSLFAIAGTGSAQGLDAYAVGDNGRIVHRLGGSWTVEANNMVSSKLNGVWIGDGAAAGEVFAVGDNGTVLHKQGSTWSAEHPMPTVQLNAVWGSSSDLYAVGAGGTILHRQGGNWKQEAMGLTGELLTAVWGTVRGGQITLYVAGNFGTLLRLDGGTWQPLSSRVTSSPLVGAWARNPGEVYVIGNNGLILRRSGTAAQGTWTTVGSGLTTAPLNAITGWSQSPTTGEAEVYAVGDTGAILHKSGTTWSIDGGFLTNQELIGVWVGQDSVYVVGRGGRMYHKTKNTWNIETGPMNMTVSNDLYAVWGTGTGAGEVVYVVGDQGLFMRHDSLGWQFEAKGLVSTSESLIALFGTNEDNLFAYGNKGGVYRRLAGKWQVQSTPPIGPGLNGIAGCVIPGTGQLLAIADQATIMTRSAGGLWSSENGLTLQPYSAVAAAALNDYYIVGSNGLILHKY